MSELRDPGPIQPLKLERSVELERRAKAVVPGLTHSMMKRPEQFCPGSFPSYLASGRGATVTDVDGNRYIDFICGLGANALGHGHPGVESAMREAAQHGLLHSLPGQLEVEVAELLVATLPGAEMARFFKTGADATSAALRLSRFLTKRDRVITVGYNGWHDHFMFDTPGVPEHVARLTSRMPLFTPADEAPLISEIATGTHAAVLLSLPYNRVPDADFFRDLCSVCSDSGTLLVLDEIVTGFRLALGGAQEYFGIEADLVCVSKALAAGMPLSAVVGPSRNMSAMAELQVSTTFGGELLSLAACGAALQVFRQGDYFEHIARLGRMLKQEINQVAESEASPLRLRGYDAIPMFLFDPNPAKHVEPARRFVGLMAERGVLLRRDVNFICGAHSEDDINHTVAATRESLRIMVKEAPSVAAE